MLGVERVGFFSRLCARRLSFQLNYLLLSRERAFFVHRRPGFFIVPVNLIISALGAAWERAVSDLCMCAMMIIKLSTGEQKRRR